MNPNLSLNLSINRNHPNNKTIEIPVEFAEDYQNQKQYKRLKDKFLSIIANLEVGDKSRKYLNALVSLQDQMTSIMSSTPYKHQSTSNNTQVDLQTNTELIQLQQK